MVSVCLLAFVCGQWGTGGTNGCHPNIDPLLRARDLHRENPSEAS